MKQMIQQMQQRNNIWILTKSHAYFSIKESMQWSCKSLLSLPLLMTNIKVSLEKPSCPVAAAEQGGKLLVNITNAFQVA